MSTVSIIGAGNVAFHLTRAFLQNTIQVKQIYNRTLSKAEEIGEANNIRCTDDISKLEKADIFIIATADDAIEELSNHIPYEDVLVLHTSGGVGMEALKGRYRKGVLYPLQTFTKERTLNYGMIPFFVEAESDADLKVIKDLASRVSHKVIEANSRQRAELHVAAVWSCNFVNHMYYLAQKIVEDTGMDFKYLQPLIKETTAKVQDLSPFDAQTGPAKRRDKRVMEKHIEIIKDSFTKELYEKISESIVKTYQV